MVSRNQIRRAGERLRKARVPSEDDRRIYNQFRDTFIEPLREVSEGIRDLADGAPVQSRLKRFETVVAKLQRGTSDLSRLEDIAGCRVVLPSMREQRHVVDRIRLRWNIARERDYQTSPRDGYRALHVVVLSRGQPVEVQVRTELEDLWANASEALAERMDPEIKYGGGPPDVRKLLDAMSDFGGRVDTRLSDLQPAIELARSLLGAIATIDRDVTSGRLAVDIDHSQRRALDGAFAAFSDASAGNGA